MDGLAGEVCLVGVKTGPKPGVAGFRGAVGCDRGVIGVPLVPVDELAAGGTPEDWT